MYMHEKRSKLILKRLRSFLKEDEKNIQDKNYILIPTIRTNKYNNNKNDTKFKFYLFQLFLSDLFLKYLKFRISY